MSGAAEVGVKTCRECGEEKPLASFIGAPREPDGHSRRCLGCIRAEAARAVRRVPQRRGASRATQGVLALEHVGDSMPERQLAGTRNPRSIYSP